MGKITTKIYNLSCIPLIVHYLLAIPSVNLHKSNASASFKEERKSGEENNDCIVVDTCEYQLNILNYAKYFMLMTSFCRRKWYETKTMDLLLPYLKLVDSLQWCSYVRRHIRKSSSEFFISINYYIL